jgi:periplasmic protein CpxP/Spy
MMGYSSNPLRGAAAAAILAVIAAGPTLASASPRIVAQASPAPGTSNAAPPTAPGQPTAVPSGPIERVDARIAELRDKLAITQAQEARFNALAAVMRRNASSMEALLKERPGSASPSAVASLKWYERLTERHGAALRRFVPAFVRLYASLTPPQRQTADAMFVRFAERPQPRRSQ